MPSHHTIGCVKNALFALALLVTTSAFAQRNPADFEPVLVPVFDGGPGAFGSFWTTRFTIYNNSTQPAGYATTVYIYPCAIPEGCTSPIPPKAAITYVQPREHVFGDTGFVIYEPKAMSNDLFYSLRVFDTTRQSVTLGTSVPVIRSSQFRESEIALLDVPFSGGYRLSLRIYSLVVDRPIDVRVRVYIQTVAGFGAPQESGQVAYERVVPLRLPAGSGIAGFPGRPSFARIDDLITGVFPANIQGTVQIGVQSITPGAPIWAFASMANNDTQQVTTIAPSL
jgi:hypothetical protein